MRKLCQKDPLCSSISFPKRMPFVGSFVDIQHPVHKTRMVSFSQKIVLLQAPKNRIPYTLDLLCGAKTRSLFGNIDRPYATSPFIKI